MPSSARVALAGAHRSSLMPPTMPSFTVTGSLVEAPAEPAEEPAALWLPEVLFPPQAVRVRAAMAAARARAMVFLNFMLHSSNDFSSLLFSRAYFDPPSPVGVKNLSQAFYIRASGPGGTILQAVYRVRARR